MTPKEAKALAKRLGEIPESFSAIFYRNGERLNYMFLATDGAELSCQQVIRTVNEAFGGRGGGAIGTLTQPARHSVAAARMRGDCGILVFILPLQTVGVSQR